MPRPFAAPVVLSLCVVAQFAVASAETPSAWPEVTQTARPWTRWWWPGSGVDEAGLTRQLEMFAQAGLGGVEITPIYGARGYEERYIPFLSPRWMEVLAHTGREGKRIGVGIDMATGTGWPFGGPWVAAADGSHKLVVVDGKLTGTPTNMKVKRAAPGGEGLVIDPYSVDAIRRYLAPFDAAFASFPRDLVRGQFHDSFEYYESGWTPGLAATFREMHGYELDGHAAALTGAAEVDEDTLRRLKGDYRATLAQLHLDYLSEWVRWSHERGWIVRNQSHGAPANLLDLYGTVDIPETETFGSTPFPIPGLRRDPRDVRSDQDLPEALVIRMASSAAHVMGRQLASSETCTWLREHWKVSLAFTKPEIDRLLANGINHILYHGTVFSPADAPWPGWLFYASTQFNPSNPWWDDFAALNAYVARVQSVLQSGKPDNEILLYWPFADVIDEPKGLMTLYGVHNVGWLTDTPFGKLAARMTEEGFLHDYISDAQLSQTRAEGSALVTPGGRYRVLVVPAARRMPVATLAHLLALRRAGANIVFEALPQDVPGLGRLEERRAQFAALIAAPEFDSTREPADPIATLLASELARESIGKTGASYIRRASATGHDYFFANLTAANLESWVALGRTAKSAVLLDPLTGREGAAALRAGASGATEVFLQLAPGESLILRTNAGSGPSPRAAWSYLAPAGEGTPITGTWSVEFVKGGPELPPAFKAYTLGTWTSQGAVAENFGGTARYRIEFDAPSATVDDWLLDLGDVRESARVRLNGVDVATAWSLPMRVRVGPHLRLGRNVLELDVTNLAANRIRDMDRRKVDWKVMHEINFVNIRYRPFDASEWEVAPSGLLGPVTLVPMRTLDPK